MGTTSNTSSLASNAQSDIPRGRLLHLNCNRFRGFLLAVVQSFLAAGFVLCILILIPKVIITFASSVVFPICYLQNVGNVLHLYALLCSAGSG